MEREDDYSAKWWEKVDNRVHCFLCPRHCHIGKGQTGFCFIRKNVDGELKLLAHSHPIAVHVDPIEKKPLFHFLPGSSILSIGTAGCNLGCKFCQNWDMSKARFDHENAYDFSPEYIVQMARSHKCPGIAYTYNEPTIFGEYVVDIAREARKYGIKNVMVTNGYITPEAIADIYPFIDAANIDLKAIEPGFYRKLTLSELQPVLEAIKIIHKMGVWIELTNLIIPTMNDSPGEIRSLVSWILDNLGSDVPLHFTAFHPDFKMKHLPKTPYNTIYKARMTALKLGINYVYEGNVLSEKGGNTYCPSCGSLLISRVWHTVISNNLTKNICKCGREIPIIL
jgi:pyruvate formate lyase activating enzyme